MKRTYFGIIKARRGIALVAALIFIVVFMAMAVGMATMSSHNAIAAGNLQTVNAARSTAESGLEVVQYWMSQVAPSTDAHLVYSETLDELETILTDAEIVYTPITDDIGARTGLHIGPVSLGQTSGRSFEARIEPEDETANVDMRVTVRGSLQGQNSEMVRTLRMGYKLENDDVVTGTANPYNWFDFGVASKGPLSLKSLEITAVEDVNGIDVKVGADAYIESVFTNAALSISNAKISGNVKIVNPNATVSWSGGQSSIGGEKNKALALANHVETGVAPVEFPVPNPAHFDQYVNGITINSANKGSYSTNVTLDNVRIAAGTNPKFTGNVTVRGVMFIEKPNVVEFGGNATITGVIVGNGDITDNSAVNQVNFIGTVNSSSSTQLPADSKFDGIRDETGTFLMAPGFAVSFGGNFGTLNGCIVANGVKTFGNAGGTIAGSILNFSDQPMLLEGKDLLFRKTGIANIPPHLKTQSSQTTTTYWSFALERTAYQEGVGLWPDTCN